MLVSVSEDGYRFEINDFRISESRSIHDYPRRLLPHFAALDPMSLRMVVQAASQYFGALRYNSERQGLSSSISVHFTQVVHSEVEYDEYLCPIVLPEGPNVYQNKEVNVVVDDGKDEMYGLKVSNVGKTPLYISALFFDNDLSIVSMTEGSSSLSITRHLDIGQSATMGYGTDGGDPWKYFLTERQTHDVGYIKVYISKQPFDLSSLRQPSPFDEGSSRSVGLSGSPGLSHPDCDTLLIPIIQRHPLNVASSQHACMLSMIHLKMGLQTGTS